MKAIPDAAIQAEFRKATLDLPPMSEEALGILYAWFLGGVRFGEQMHRAAEKKASSLLVSPIGKRLQQ